MGRIQDIKYFILGWLWKPSIVQEYLVRYDVYSLSGTHIAEIFEDVDVDAVGLPITFRDGVRGERDKAIQAIELNHNHYLKDRAKQILDALRSEEKIGQTRNSLFVYGPHLSQIIFTVVELREEHLSYEDYLLCNMDPKTVVVGK